MLMTRIEAPPDTLVTLESIATALEPYLEAARHGTTNGLRACFLDDARIVGWVDGQYLCLDPDAFTGWVASEGPSPSIRHKIVSTDVSGGAAAVRIEFENWLGFHFTDFFLLEREPGGWRISSKVYDAHERSALPSSLTPAGDDPDWAEITAIASVLADYVEGARSGDRARLRGIWFDHARIVGQLDGGRINRDPDSFSASVAQSGGMPALRAHIVSIARCGTAASARIELKDWNGVRYTDFFTLLKGPDGWRVSGKVFDAHDRA